MDEKIEYLKKYNSDITIIGEGGLSVAGISALPGQWREIFSTQDFDVRKMKLLDYWDECKTELGNTIAYLKENLVGADLVKINNSYSILYTVRNRKGKTVYYEGKMPAGDKPFLPGALHDYWGKLPGSVTRFYTKVHNGFYYYASESMGLVPLQSVTYLDDFEWGILEELEGLPQINLKSSFGFFTNGMGGYVVIDAENCSEEKAALWWTKKMPKYNINFWDVVDEWIVIGFDS